MGYVLFSPIGNTDPVRGFRDGAWLHICRVYRPRMSVIYLTADMCRKEDVIEADGSRKDLYVRTIELLNKHLFGGERERYIQLERIRDTECEEAHSLEYFMPRFQKALLELHQRFTEEKLLVNVSSGTAGMKSLLIALSTMMPFKVYPVQVSDPAMGKGRKTEIVNETYPVEEAFELDEDNEADFPNRTSEQKLVNLVMAMQVNELCRLVQEGDYHTVLQEVQGETLKAHVTAQAHDAIQGAVYRDSMKLQEAGKLLKASGFELGEQIRSHSGDRLWLCAEYLLTMKNDLKREAYDDFVRKLTPLLTNLFELYLAYKGKDVRKQALDKYGKWDMAKIPDEWRRLLDNEFYPAFKGGYLAGSNMLPLIKAYGDRRAFDLARMLRDAEEKVRNMVAHEIVPFERKEIEKKLKEASISEIKTPEALIKRCRELLECIRCFDSEYWNSYDAMNAHICGLLKSTQR